MSWNLSNPTTPLNWLNTATDSTGQYIISCTDTNVYLSSNYGVDFILSTNGLPTVTSPNMWTSVASNPSGTCLLVCGYSTNGSQLFNGLYLSTNSGVSWENISMSTIGGNPQYSKSPVAIDQNNNLYLLQSNNSRVYKSTNLGVSWVNLGTGINGTPNSVSVSYDGRVIVSTGQAGIGAYISRDYGATFTQYFISTLLASGGDVSSDGSIIYISGTTYASSPYTYSIFKSTVAPISK